MLKTLILISTMLVAYLATAAGLGSGMLLSQANTLFALKIGIGAGVLSVFIIVPLLQRKLPSSRRFLWLSFCIVTNPVYAQVNGIHWVIVGGESGSKARPMQKEWVLSIKQQAENQNAEFFFKQWGTWGSDGIKRSKRANGKKLQGEIFQAMPAYL